MGAGSGVGWPTTLDSMVSTVGTEEEIEVGAGLSDSSIDWRLHRNICRWGRDYRIQLGLPTNRQRAYNINCHLSEWFPHQKHTLQGSRYGLLTFAQTFANITAATEALSIT